MALRFEFEEIFPIAMIKSEEEVRNQIVVIKRLAGRIAKIRPELDSISAWKVFEISGFDTSTFITSLKNGVKPFSFQIEITEDQWREWSPAKRESFKSMFKNPNTYFYRNRPPGEPARHGHFSQEEEQQLIDRLLYFRNELGIYDGLWGLFAVPLTGRVGYQCSNFCRTLRDEKRLPPLEPGPENWKKTEKYEESLKKLNNEAFEYIFKIAHNTESGKLSVPEPVFIPVDNGHKRARRTMKAREPEELAPRRMEKVRAPVAPANEDVQSSESDETESYYTDSETESDFYSESGSDTPFDLPIWGAIDPITKTPMDQPAISPLGIVMDYSSWDDVINGRVDSPYEIGDISLKDIVRLVKRNFDDYRDQIVNVLF